MATISKEVLTIKLNSSYVLISTTPFRKTRNGMTSTSPGCPGKYIIEYVVYDGQSEHERCGLYVCYQSVKNNDGSWYYTNGTIVDIYAYVYENGDVISSGKTDWSDIGSEAFQEITGEK